MMNSRQPCSASIAFLFLTGLLAAEERVVIVEQGRAQATVRVPENADSQTAAAAELLVNYVKRASGATLPVAADPIEADEKVAVQIHVGQTDFVSQLDLPLQEMDDDGFVIRGADANNLVIVGPTPWGTEFGVCEFLERYLGVRWLMPGPHGEDVPQTRTIEVPLEEVRQEPAFFSRLFSGLTGSGQTTWARRNRMHGRVSFHHNLLRVFPPETYTKTHPHFFPIRDGKRLLPVDSHQHGWQPCFSAEGSVEEAVKNICRYFDERPDVPSFSLGVNDSSGHCQCADCQAQDPEQPNFLGRRDVSDRYFAWCNQVAEGVLRTHPDKFFGCLAYSEVAQPPSRVKIHERIIPYMTYDRMKWVDPELEADGHRITKWWQQTSPVVGWYDYIYGSAYCLPRVWFHHMADYYRFGYDHGVRAMYAEAYPNWGEGPKLYISLRLQWNPDQDVDQLLSDWYQRTVGPKAADDLAAYFAQWEDFWTRRILDSPWFTKGGQYLRFNHPGYLADVTEEDLRRSRELLHRVLQNTETPEQKARAEMLMLAFEYYEASAAAYAGKRLAETLVVQSEQQALEALERAERCLHMAVKRRRMIQDVFPKHPELLHQIDVDRYAALRGDDWASGLMWLAFDWADRSQRVRQQLEHLAASKQEAASLQAKTVLTVLDRSAPAVSANPSFEDGDGGWPSPWSRWIKWGVGTKTVSPAAARTGEQGIACRGMRRGGPHQRVEVQPGRYAAVLYFRVPKPPQGDATITLSMTPLGPDGENLSEISTTTRAAACDWTRLATAGEIPAELHGRAVTAVRLIAIVDGFEEGEQVHLDDCSMFRIDR